MILGGILIALACWALTFGLSAGNFWLKIGFSVIFISLYSLIWQRPKISFRFNSILWGSISSLLLYIIFFIGNKFASYIFTGSNSQVENIYSLGMGTNKILVFLLLFFITGPGEEIFWRGFIQDRLMVKWGYLRGYLITTIIYSGVHIFSGNSILILASFVAGAFWGLLYLWKRDLLIQIVSHSLWGAVIFIFAPIQ